MSKKEIIPGPTATDITVDLVVVGSGTGMAAALAAHELGLKVLVIEKTALVGGSTARSGGAFWIPANPVLKQDGSDDTLKDGETYLTNLVGDNAPKSRWENFLQNGSAAVEMLERTTPMKFFWAKGYSDYFPEVAGGKVLGRTCECRPFNMNLLGKDTARFRPGQLEAPVPVPVTGYDYKWLNLMTKTPFKSIPIMLKRGIQGIGGLLIGKRLVGGGQALASGMFAGLLRSGVPVWTNTSITELLFDGDKVTGIKAVQNGKLVQINAKKGVVLAGGGFDHNMLMRHQYQSPSLKNVSLGSEGNTGDTILLGEKIGAEITNMTSTWWFPAIAPLTEEGEPQVLLAERSLPGSFLVNYTGKRFINEAVDYMSFGQIVLEQEKYGTPIKDMWLIFDQNYRNSYLLAGTLFPGMKIPQEWFDAKIAFTAENASELAQKVGLPVEAFTETFGRFNTIAATGKDTDFGKGNSAYDRYYGDPTQMPNNCLRPLSGKLYAVKIVLSDLGTCGGMMTNEHGQVLKTNQTAFQGLYALGNNASNIFGNKYPGAGGTIGQGLVFGYIIAHHAAKK